MRKIVVITGTRANYGRLKPVMKAIERHDNLELKLIVTGMHLVGEFGLTVREIESDGFKIDEKVDMHISNDSGAGMCKSLGLGIIGMTQAIEKIKPDIIMILGDRDEDLAGAIIGAHMNIPVAHIHGGEVTGTIDESIRHAITKFSHIHFTATHESRERVLKLGERKEYVFNVGSPGLDSILKKEYLSREKILKKFNINLDKRVIIVAQHPVTTERKFAEKQMKETLEAISELNEEIILIYPNSDAGGREMIKVIEKFKSLDNLHIYENINFEDYLNLLKHADLMIGNSSSGIMEAPSYKLPVINIGTRQLGRECSSNVINVNYDKKEIINAANLALYDEEFKIKVKSCENPYGDGNTGERIADILSNLDIKSEKIIQKQITY